MNSILNAAAAKSFQSCPTLCDSIDGSPPGSPVLGILQARTLEWVAISFSSAWKWKVKVKLLSRVRFLAIRWTAAHKAPPSIGFSRQEYWSGVPLPSPPWCANLTQFWKSQSVQKQRTQRRECPERQTSHHPLFQEETLAIFTRHYLLKEERETALG